MIRASIDLGTNTALLLIVEWEQGKKASPASIRKVLWDEATVVRLGEGVDKTRELQKEPMKRTLACLLKYSQKVSELGLSPSQVICVATSQARDAKNSTEFFSKVEQTTGFQFKVLSGDDEARCTFEGALLPGQDPHKTSVIDIGGGSTEIISGGKGQSLNLGSVRFTERFLKSDPVTDEEFWQCQEVIDQALLELKQSGSFGGSELVGVAGTVTTLAAWHLGLEKFDREKVDSRVLTRGDIHRLVEELKWRTLKERRALPGMEPLRADVLLAGALILWRTLEILGYSEVVVSTRGLRYGVLYS